MDITEYLKKNRGIVNKALIEYLPKARNISAELTDAMRYSIAAGGKRLRPILMIATAEMFDKKPGRVLQAACAVEYVHTSTLILDDLPCMDNSDLRRGSPSVHKKFGQSTAILASYALVALAFELLMKNANAVSDDSKLALDVTESMSDAIGYKGICAGQYMDLRTGPKKIGLKGLRFLHEHKTADLFVASCRIAGYLSAAGNAQLKALSDYGKYLGLAFQAYDDMLSLNKTDRELGKQAKKDINSPNIVNLFGSDKARGLLKKYSQEAEAALHIFGSRSDTLKGFIQYVSIRNK